MNLVVVGPRVFVRPDKLPEVSEGGLHLVHSERSQTMVGEVVALGDGPNYVDVGERVLFSPDSGQEVIFEKDVLIVLENDAILAVVE